MKFILLLSHLLFFSVMVASAEKVVISKAEVSKAFKFLFKGLAEGEVDKADLPNLLEEFSYEEGKFPRADCLLELNAIMNFFEKASVDIRWLSSYVEGSKDLSDVQLLVVLRTARWLKSEIQSQIEKTSP